MTTTHQTLGKFFGGPDDLGTVQERIAQTVAAIDWTRPDIVLWLPGTSEHETHAGFRDAVAGVFGHAPAVVVYEASWRMQSSMADGQAVLRGVLNEVKRRMAASGRHYNVMLAGQSQGAWIISDVMAEAAYAGVVTRATLFGHPGVATHHNHTTAGSVVEYNNPGDAVAIPIRGDARELTAALEGAASGRILPHIGFFAGVAVQNPAYLSNWLFGLVRRLPPFGSRTDDPHVYNLDMYSAAVFLKDGRRIGRAASPRDALGVAARLGPRG